MLNDNNRKTTNTWDLLLNDNAQELFNFWSNFGLTFVFGYSLIWISLRVCYVEIVLIKYHRKAPKALIIGILKSPSRLDTN